MPSEDTYKEIQSLQDLIYQTLAIPKECMQFSNPYIGTSPYIYNLIQAQIEEDKRNLEELCLTFLESDIAAKRNASRKKLNAWPWHRRRNDSTRSARTKSASGWILEC